MGRRTSVAAPPPPDSDLFAEWDSAETIDAVVAAGGEIMSRCEDSPETIALFRDPGGNVIGLYQEPS